MQPEVSLYLTPKQAELLIKILDTTYEEYRHDSEYDIGEMIAMRGYLVLACALAVVKE